MKEMMELKKEIGTNHNRYKEFKMPFHLQNQYRQKHVIFMTRLDFSLAANAISMWSFYAQYSAANTTKNATALRRFHFHKKEIRSTNKTTGKRAQHSCDCHIVINRVKWVNKLN